MFEAYTITPSTYGETGIVTFPIVRARNPRYVNHTDTTFTLHARGRYLVMANFVASSTTAAAEFTVQMYRDGVAVPGATATITSGVANEKQTMGIATVVDVKQSCACVDNTTNIQFVVTSIETGTIHSANVIIEKVA